MALLPASITQAEETTDRELIQFLFLHTKSGGIVKYSLTDQPTITFNNNEVIVEDDKYLFSNILKYTFVEPSGTSAVSIIEDSDIFSYRDGRIIVSSKIDMSNCHISDLKGISYPLNITFPSTEEVEIDLSNLPTNHYILTIDQQAIKFIKK